jgi:hypothetical protein
MTQPHTDLSRGEVLGCDEASSRDEVKLSNIMCTLNTDMYLVHSESSIIDLYCLDNKDEQWNSVAFQYALKLNSPKGEVVRLKSTFNDSAMASTVDLKAFQSIKHHLDPLQKSNRILCMADGRLVPSTGVWNRRITIDKVSHTVLRMGLEGMTVESRVSAVESLTPRGLDLASTYKKLRPSFTQCPISGWR